MKFNSYIWIYKFLNKETNLSIEISLQLENELGSDSTCEDRVTNHVVPCIGLLASAAQDDSLWKVLNYQILLKTRNENPKVSYCREM